MLKRFFYAPFGSNESKAKAVAKRNGWTFVRKTVCPDMLMFDKEHKHGKLSAHVFEKNFTVKVFFPVKDRRFRTRYFIKEGFEGLINFFEKNHD